MMMDFSFKQMTFSGLIKNARNMSLYFFTSVLSAVVSVALNPFLAKNLSYEDYSIIGFYTSFNFLLSPLLSFAFNVYYSRRYFLISDEERPRVLNTLLGATCLWGGIMSCISLLIMWLYSMGIKNTFPFFPYAILSVLTVFLSCITSFFFLEKRMQGDAKNFFIVSIIQLFFILLFNILFVILLKYGAVGRLFACMLPVLLIAMYTLKKLYTRIELDWVVIKDAIKFGWPLFISLILNYFFSGIDRILLVDIGNEVEYGLYNIAFTIASYLIIFHTTISQTFDPDIYRSIAQENYRRVISVGLMMVFSVTIPVLLCMICSKFILYILTFGRYTDAASYFSIMALRCIFMSSYAVLSTIIIALGKTKVELFIKVLAALLSLIAYAILIKHWDYKGAAWGQVLSYLFLTIVGFLYLLKNKTLWAKI